MNVAERKQTTAPADAQRWLESFEAALQAQDTAAAAELFLPDGLWRDVLAFTWTIQTLSGRPAIEAMLRETLARTKPRTFSFSGKENIAALAGRAPERKPSRPCSNSKPRSVPAPALSGLFPMLRRGCAHGRSSRRWKNSRDTRRYSAAARRRRTTAYATSARRTGATVSPERAPTPTTIRQSLWSAAARAACRSPRVCISSASTR